MHSQQIMTTQKKTFDLSVVIVNYNVEYFLEQCLNSVREASQKCATEIFVVDNNSNDGSVQMVQEKFPEVKLIANKDNKGFSSANTPAINKQKANTFYCLTPIPISLKELTFKKITDFMKKIPLHVEGQRMVDGRGDFYQNQKEDF